MTAGVDQVERVALLEWEPSGRSQRPNAPCQPNFKTRAAHDLQAPENPHPVPALAGAVFAKGDPLTVDATGRFITQVTAGGKFFAVAEELASAAGQLVEVRLIDGYATI